MAETKEAGMVERLRKVVLSASYVDDIELTDDNADAIVLAVLEELREPTEAMIKASLPEAWIGHPEASEGTIERYWAGHRRAGKAKWQAMIDAALSQDQSHDR